MYETLRFLVADDNTAVRMIIKEILRGFGARSVEWAADGAAALQLLKTQPFDVLVTDMVMPGVSGVELTKAVRSGGLTTKANIPIILLSGNMDRATLVAARNAGVSEFVAKPVVVANLHARLEACMRRPRPFIVSTGYTGPCRRRNPAAFPYTDRRSRKKVVEV
jgi:two-component system, chemotaxis family, chemotaxis protein CheY